MAKSNISIIKGSTYTNKFRWESPKKLYRAITAITVAAPIVVTAVAHGIPSVWRGKITNVLGMTDINNSTDYYELTKLTTDTIEINSINAMAFKPYVSGGTLEYQEPINMTGYTARMQVRATISDPIVLVELTTANGKINIDTVNSTITLVLSATETAALSWSKGVYSVELVSSGGIVTNFLEGNVSVSQEVTR